MRLEILGDLFLSSGTKIDGRSSFRGDFHFRTFTRCILQQLVLTVAESLDRLRRSDDFIIHGLFS